MSDFGNLVVKIRQKKPSIRIIISSILPRPLDHVDTDSMLRGVNTHLGTVVASDLNFHFIHSLRALSKFGTYRRNACDAQVALCDAY